MGLLGIALLGISALFLSSCSPLQLSQARSQPGGIGADGFISTGSNRSNRSNDALLPANIPSSAINPIMDYVEALNIALDTGNIFAFSSSEFTRCGCTKIAKAFTEIYSRANLTGGDYELTEISSLRNGDSAIALLVKVERTSVTMTMRASGEIEIWPEAEIAIIFELERSDTKWTIVGTRTP